MARSLKNYHLALIASLLLSATSTLRATDLILTDEGISPPPIIVFKDAPPRTREAALELAGYIERVS